MALIQYHDSVRYASLKCAHYLYMTHTAIVDLSSAFGRKVFELLVYLVDKFFD
jgi:hypothetical protein